MTRRTRAGHLGRADPARGASAAGLRLGLARAVAMTCVGVILPATLTFNTGVPEIMETVSGSCRVRLKGESDWKEYGEGQSFNVPGNSSFDIEVREPYHYVCHFG